MKRIFWHKSRTVAWLASALTAISSIALTPLPAQAAQVSNGECLVTVDNSTGVSTYDGGTHCYVAFKSTGINYNWTRPSGISTFDLLVVAGGGGGGARHAAGGGAGGVIFSESNSITANSIAVSVGAGGAGAAAQVSGVQANGSNGANSSVSATGFTTQTAIGGGYGSSNGNGGSGGSGGGAYCCGASGGTPTSGQGLWGSIGATGFYNGNQFWIGGAGGGAAGNASDATSSAQAGVGGPGRGITWITTAAGTSLGAGQVYNGFVYFGGGGGGGTARYGSAGSGGIGGGGAGGAGGEVTGTAWGQAGTSGTTNTGGGGGGGGYHNDNTSPAGGSGGSGVVIFRWAKVSPVLSWNASDVNSFEETVSTTAINDLSASNFDGTLYSGSNAVAPGFDRTTGAWTFTGGASSTGPYVKTNSSISTTPFNTSGVTIDFQANFGSTADLWERVMDFSSNASQSDNLLIARNGTSNDFTVEVYSGNTSPGYCTKTGAITNGEMARWTVSLDGVKCRIWKNGSLIHDVSYTGKPRAGATWTNTYLARSNWVNDSSLEGSIRYFRMYAGALDASEIPAPVEKTVTMNAYDGNAQNGGGVTNNMQSPRLTTGSVRLPTPITRAGYTFTGWYDSTSFTNKVGDAGGVYTPSSSVTLYGGWRTVTSSVTGNLVMNFDATNISSYPSAGGSAYSIWPGSHQVAASSVTTGARDTANSPGALNLTATSGSAVVSFGANNATNITGAISYETWVKFSYINTGATAWNVIASHWFADTSGTAATDWHFGIYGAKLQVNAGASNIGVGSKTWTSADQNKWFLLGFTIDASNNLQIYINGKPDGSVITGMAHAPNTSALMWIGDGRSGTVRMQGYVSRARLYNAALTSSQMLNNFSGEAVTYGMGPYTLTYKAGPNGTGSDVVETYNAGVSATLKNNTAPFTRAGYYISGWTTSSASGAAQTNALTSSLSMDSSVILYPVWTATSYTITYNYNGATGGNGTASASYVAGGTAITLPTPTKTGYSFDGWWSTSGFTTGTQVTGAQTPSSNFTLYAKWAAQQFTLTFKANNGLATADITQTVTDGVAVALRSNTFTKTNSAFGRWSDVASGLSSNSWTNGQTIAPTGNMTFYAIWNDDAHIIFDSNGGSAVADAYTVGLPLAGATPLAKPTDPTKAGKIFGGWSTSVANGNGLATAIVTWPRDYEINATETLYAIWLDACAPTKTTFSGTGTADSASATFGTSGVAYTQLRFNTVGSCAWTVPNEVTALDVLLVGGGGAGSYYGRAGGGGAGLLLHTATSYSTSAGTNIPISVGAGGDYVHNSLDGSRGTSGSPSAFANIIADGGGAGAGGAGTLQAAAIGGSGGGAACINGYTTGGGSSIRSYAGWSGYANVGGNASAGCSTGSALYGAGGGGAGGAGNSNSTGGASLTRFGVELAGGGAGWLSGTTAQGGGSVGGDWIANSCPAPATPTNNGVANTGSGGASCGQGAAGTVIVRFATPTYTTTYTYNGATGGATIPSTNSVGNGLTLPNPTKTGYTFGGWYADAGFTVSIGAGGASYTPTADSTIYAKWNGGTSVITYEYNGATGGNTTVSSSYTSGGTAITLPTPTKTGYTFGGWYREANFTTVVTGTQTPTADATLYAKWTAINYTLTYSSTLSTSGTVPTDATNYNIGSVVSVSSNTGNLARTGYSFAGWTVAADGSGAVLTSGQSVTFATSNITLYAKWTANTYAISYNVNGATGSQANASDSYTTGGTAVTLSAVGTMTKTGHTFSGWSATPTGSVIAGTYTTTTDVTLYAIWTIQVISVTYDKGTAASASFISFPANTSGNYGTRITVSNNIDSSVTYSSNTYAFVGWTDGTSMYQAGQQYLLGTSSVTLTAVWVQAFGVRYIVNGGTFANGTSAVDAECLVVGNLCTNGQSVTANAAPTRTGYTFTGWTDQSNNAIAAGSAFTVNINSYLLYAGWSAISYSITYSPNGGSSTPTQSSLNYADTFTLAAGITRTGYTFNGWSDGTTTFGAGTTYTVGTNNVTLTAQWTPLTYVITYDWNGGIGSATPNANYTVGTSGITLPTVGNHVKDGFNFVGWSLTNGGFALSSPFIPTSTATLYAIWGSGSYTINYDLNYGAQASSTATIANGNSTVLPTPSRSNFVFDGWYTASTGGSKIGNAGANFTPAGSSTLYARWIQASLYGVIGNLNRISTITASDSVSSSYNGTAGGSSVSVTVPSATLPAGTIVALDVITDTSYAQSLLTGTNNYILSIAVSWLAPNETVPDTNSGKSVSMTISNNSIRAGALVYSIQNGVVTLLGTATQNGTITVQLTSDPSVYVVATVPTVPQTIASTQTSTSATVTWAMPNSDGGSAITGYIVTLNTGATCTTTLLTCTFNNLTAGTAYTANVVASNAVGSSVVGTVTFTPTAPISGGSPAPVTPNPPVVVPPKPTEPETPVVPIVVPVPLAKAIEKIMPNNVPVLAGTPVVTPILFNPYSAKLDAKDMAMIKAAAQALKDKSGWLFVTGFVKYEGAGTQIEKNLAKARATAVAKQLAKLGLKVKIGYLGYGAPNKLAPKPTDRKVELRWQAEPSQNS